MISISIGLGIMLVIGLLIAIWDALHRHEDLRAGIGVVFAVAALLVCAWCIGRIVQELVLGGNK